MKILVSQSHGSEREYKRSVLALLSFWALYSGEAASVHTILATDQPEYFKGYLEGLSVEYIFLTPDKIKTMRGRIDFVHRLKIAVLEEVFFLYPAADILYIDGDTIFQKDPISLLNRITGNNSFMHLVEFEYNEYKKFAASGMGEANHQPFIDFLEHNRFKTSKGEEEFHSLATWNAGVMGLPAKVAEYLPDIYYLTEEFYKAAPLYGSEQAAFSFVLQTRVNLQACEEYVYHYWGTFKKQIIDLILAKEVTRELAKLKLRNRLQKVKELARHVPVVVKTHEDALHALNVGETMKGFKYAYQAMLMIPPNRAFIKHLLYHIKRIALKRMWVLTLWSLQAPETLSTSTCRLHLCEYMSNSCFPV